ncbi:MAG: bifunctional 3-deoxy-7-phosphoheptulonate synthase/chorismate mutase [Trueperaceae bacterium]
MPESKITELRAEIDKLNLELLQTLSKRAAIAQEIGSLQTSAGTSTYDPMREKEMLEALVAANPGPFDAGTIKSLFKSIFQASMEMGNKAEKPKFLTSRATKQEDTVVMVGDIAIGGKHSPVLVAGPCAIESKEQVMMTAEFVASRGVKLFRGGAYKPRTDPYSFQGLGEKGLQIGREACDKYGMKFVAEIMDARDIDLFIEYVDVLQIGARNSQNFTLLRTIGQKTTKPVLLKRGLSSKVEEWIMSAEYLLSEGNPNVILCERGIRTYETYTRNTLDVSAVALAKLETHLPVLVDVTHSGGRRDLLVPLTKAGLAIGADGIMIEVHPNPAVALSDQKQQVDFEQFDQYLKDTGYHGKLSEKRFEVYGF